MPTCQTCRHFYAAASACRRFPPVNVMMPQRVQVGMAMLPVALFPTVNATDSVCGEHRPEREE